MPGQRTAPAADLARTVVFAAFIAVLGLFPGLYLGGAAVPVVLQNTGSLLAGSILGARRASAAVLLFLGLVVLGLPLLSGGRGGLAPFAGPSGGFLLGWLLSAFVVGLIVQRAAPRPGLVVLLLANLAGVAADYVIGIPYWAAFTGDLWSAAVQSVVFLPGDAVKLVLVSLVAVAVHRALPDVLGRSAKSGASGHPGTSGGPGSHGDAGTQEDPGTAGSSSPSGGPDRTEDAASEDDERRGDSRGSASSGG